MLFIRLLRNWLKNEKQDKKLKIFTPYSKQYRFKRNRQDQLKRGKNGTYHLIDCPTSTWKGKYGNDHEQE